MSTSLSNANIFVGANCHFTQSLLKFPKNFKQFQLNSNLHNESYSKDKEILNKFMQSNYLEYENPLKKSNDEYSELSYLNINFIKNTNNLNSSNFLTAEQKAKKSLELDFKIKYKTEKCKYWEINQTCKFGDSVRKFFIFFIFSVLSPMDLMILEKKQVMLVTIKLKNASNFLKMGIVLMGKDVNLFI